ncbi:TPA: hypothetical protein ACQEDG_000676 [Streptococcus pyogenes]
MGTIAPAFMELLLDANFCKAPVNNQDTLLKVYHREMAKDNVTIPYEIIAEYVYSREDSVEENEKLNSNIDFIISEFSGTDTQKNILIKNLDKIKSNYSLAQTQKKFILKNSQEAKDVLEKIIPELNTLAKETSNLAATNDELKKQSAETDGVLQKVKQGVDDVRNTKSSIYTDFIAILGVFSAFVFVMFGGIDVARAIFDIGNDLQTLDLSRMITVSSLMLIGVLTLMYSLLLWVARITGKNFGNCYSSKCDNGCRHKWRHFLMRHSFYFSLMFLLVLTTVVSHCLLK